MHILTVRAGPIMLQELEPTHGLLVNTWVYTAMVVLGRLNVWSGAYNKMSSLVGSYASRTIVTEIWC